MKKLSFNVTNITLSLAFIFTTFILPQQTSADTYAYGCNDGGIVASVVDMVPRGPFSSSNPKGFKTSGYLQSSCGTRNVNLTVQNNNGNSVPLIPTQIIFQGGFLGPFYDLVNFISPTAAGKYAVSFVTGVDEPSGIVTLRAFPYANTVVHVATSAAVTNTTTNMVTIFGGTTGGVGVPSISKALTPGSYTVTQIKCENYQKVFGPIGTANPNSFTLTNNSTVTIDLAC